MMNKIKCLPYFSAVTGFGGTAAALKSTAVLPAQSWGMADGFLSWMTSGAPYLSAALVLPAAVNLASPGSSKMSKAFSLAAVGAGVAGAASLFMPEAAATQVAGLALSHVGMAAAGVLNVAAELTKGLKSAPKAAEPAPAPAAA